MHLLQTFIDRRATLIDYEMIVDPRTGKRLVAFGRFAGMVGMIDTLSLLGQRLADTYGIRTPFAKVQPAHHYANLADIKAQLRSVGDEVRTIGLPKELTPMIFGFTGTTGRCAGGSTEIFDELRPKMLNPHDVLDADVLRSLPGNEIYGFMLARVGEEGRYLRRDSRPSTPDDLAADPEAYQSTLSRYLENMTALVHTAFWKTGQPTLVSRADLLAMKTDRLKVVGDISCDVWPSGPMECTKAGTKVEDPYYVYNPQTDRHVMGIKGPGIAVNAVETMPCEMPYDASLAFSEMLAPFIPAIANGQYRADYESGILSLPEAIRPAVVVWNGEIAPRYNQTDYPRMHEQLARYARDYSIDVNV